MEMIYWDVGGWPLESVVEETRKLTKQLAADIDQLPERHADPVEKLGERLKQRPHTRTSLLTTSKRTAHFGILASRLNTMNCGACFGKFNP
jgi:hypothetical protein